MKKKFLSMLIVTTLAMTAVSCSTKNDTANEGTTNNEAVEENTDSTNTSDIKGKITLNNSGISVDGEGVSIADNIVTITAGGTYEVTGTLDDGQIIVDSVDEENVYIILNGVNIKCSNSAPIYVKNAKNTILTLAENSENYVEDGSEYVYEELNEDGTVTDEPNACIFSKDDLTINGEGTLTVTANYNNGIASKDDLKVTGGNINVTAVNNGVKGKDSITVKGGNIVVNAEGDGLKSDNTEDTEKGYIIIEGGSLDITSGQDGIQAETALTISSGEIKIVSGGGSVNAATHAESFQMGPWGNTSSSTSSDTETTSAKALKAGVSITADGGNITIDSADDSVHTNDSIIINAGTFNLKSGDDGIHADNTLEINGGEITITESYEGLEATDIVINEGKIKLVASDDGINAAGGNDSSNEGGFFGGDQFSASSGTLTINGGYISLDAEGDGLDANGNMIMTGGTVVINGPTNGGNGALDYDGTFEISGGLLIAAGSVGMVQTPSTTSTQPAINITLPTAVNNQLVTLLNESGEEILSFMSSKSCQSIIISSPELVLNENYSVYYGGTPSGNENDGVYTEGTASGGSELTQFTLSSSIMTVSQSGATEGGSNGMGGPGGGMQGGGGMPGGGMPQR